MSARERCLSLDRAAREQNVLQSGGYMPERSPRRSSARACRPQSTPCTPDIVRDSFHESLPQYSLEHAETVASPATMPPPCALELQHEYALESQERQRICRSPAIPRVEDIPYLDDYEQPSFSEPPAEASFPDLMCIMASPPPPPRSSPPRRPFSPVPPQLSPPRPAEAHVDYTSSRDAPQHTIPLSPPMCPYKIPPLPDDPYDIPPHPKNAKDVVGFIRRSRAIHRLKALQEAARKEEEANAKQKIRQQHTGGVRNVIGDAAAKNKFEVYVPKRTGNPPRAPVKVPMRPPVRPPARLSARPPTTAPAKVAVKPPVKPPGRPPVRGSLKEPVRQTVTGTAKGPVRSLPSLRQPVGPPARQTTGLSGRPPSTLVKPKATLPSKLIPPQTGQTSRLLPPKAAGLPCRLTQSQTGFPSRPIPSKYGQQPSRFIPSRAGQGSRLIPPQAGQASRLVPPQAAQQPSKLIQPRTRQASRLIPPQAGQASRLMPPKAGLPSKLIQRKAVFRPSSSLQQTLQSKPSATASQVSPVECSISNSTTQRNSLSPRYSSAREFQMFPEEEIKNELVPSSQQAVAVCQKAADAPTDHRNLSLEEYEALERQYCGVNSKATDSPECRRDVSLDEFEALERQYCAVDARPMDSPECHVGEEFEALERQCLGIDSGAMDFPGYQGGDHSLDEFEALERQFCGVDTRAMEYPDEQFQTAEEAFSMRHRIGSLQRQLLEGHTMQQNVEDAPPSPDFELPPVIRYYDFLQRQRAAAAAADATAAAEEFELDLNECYVDPNLYEDVADWKLEQLEDIPTAVQSPRTPVPRMMSTSAQLPARSSPATEDVDMLNLPFGNTAMADTCNIDDIDLAEVSMPLEDDIFNEVAMIDEFDLENVSSPELDEDLTISALESYCPQIVETESSKILQCDQQRSPGFFSSIVTAVVKTFRIIFGGTPKETEKNDEDEENRRISLNSSLPNMFETTPPSEPSPTIPQAGDDEFAVPEYPQECVAMVQKAQLIQRKQNEAKAAGAAKAAKPLAAGRKPLVKSTITKRAPLRGRPGIKKPRPPPKKVYPPGEHSPGHVEAVAKARTLAGLQNRSDLLNPERKAKIAAMQAQKEAEVAAEAALPPVERMKARMARLKREGKQICPQPTIETLGALEAIKANLPREQSMPALKEKWTPAPRRRVDRSGQDDEGLFGKSMSRIFDGYSPLTPCPEESYNEEDLIQFSPLRPREGRLRLEHLKERALQRAGRMESPIATPEYMHMPESTSITYSPIMLESPGQVHTAIPGDRVGDESVTEEVTKTSTMQDGKVHTTTRKVTTATDEFGNVSCQVVEDSGENENDAEFADDLEAVEAPEFLDISDTAPPRNLSLPTPAEIIDKVRKQVQQTIRRVMPQASPFIESQNLAEIALPEDLPDEELFEIDMPELDTTPLQQEAIQAREQPSPDTSLPYLWGERPKSPVVCPTTPQRTPPPLQKPSTTCPQPRQTPVDEAIVLPPIPKNPKDYAGMVNYARALHKLNQQQVARATTAAAARPPSHKAAQKMPSRVPPRVPLSRRPSVPISRRPLPNNKQIAPKKLRPPPCEGETTKEPPPLPPGYTEQVAKARSLAGYKNRTAALNPIVAAEMAEFENLSDYEKIQRRMEQVRKGPAKKPKVRASADIIGTLEGIKANLPPPPPAEQVCIPEEQFEEQQVEQYVLEQPPRGASLDEFENLERLLALEADMGNKYDEVREEKLLASVESPHDAFSMKQRINELECNLLGEPSNNLAYYEQLVGDFCPPRQQYGREGQAVDGDLVLSSPVDARERFRRIKERQQELSSLPEDAAPGEPIASPSIAYSPIQLISPSEPQRSIRSRSPETCPSEANQRDILVDLATPKAAKRVKQFQELDLMPFDELECEDEPSYAHTSFDRPMSPPPAPAELISRIRREVQERIRSDRSLQMQMSNLEFPEDIPEEDILGTTAPSLAGTPRAVSPRPLSATQLQSEQNVTECPMLISSKSVGDINKRKHPKGYVDQVMKARELHKLKQQQLVEKPSSLPSSDPAKTKERVSQPVGRAVLRKGLVRPPTRPLPKAQAKGQIKGRTKPQSKPIPTTEEIECPSEPPQLPPKYVAEVAKARELAGLKNRTAALNPEVAVFEALPKPEQLKIRMDCLRQQSGTRQPAKPTMEQFAYLQAMKVAHAAKSPVRQRSPETVCAPQRASLTPGRPISESQASELEEFELAEFEAAEIEAMEQEEGSPRLCPPVQGPSPMVGNNLDQIRTRADAQMQQLASPPLPDAHERYRRLIAQAQSTPAPIQPQSPVKTPQIHYTPIPFPTSPKLSREPQKTEKSKTKIRQCGDKTIKEQIIETSEMVNGQLQQSRKVITTTTDPAGNVSCQINESTQYKIPDIGEVEDLGGVEQPSFQDTTPLSPMGIPRPKDIIERVRKDVESRPKPIHVPTGQLIDLRTQPPALPLPQYITEEELLDMSLPQHPETPPRTPRQSPRVSQNVSLPKMFIETPEPPPPPLPSVSPLRYRVHSPPGPTVVPPCPTDPNDYRGMVRMSRKIYELKQQQEAEAKAEAETAQAAAAAAAAAEAAKPKQRMPISRWPTAGPPRAPTKRKRLVMRKRVPAAKEATPECSSEAPPLPEGYAEEVARARQLAGLKSVNANLNPQLAAAMAAEEEKQAKEAKRIQGLLARPPGPADYQSLTARMKLMRQHKLLKKVQPTLQSSAYLNAVKGAMEYNPCTNEPAESRLKRIMEARSNVPCPAPEEIEIDAMQISPEIHHSPVPLGSPIGQCRQRVCFDTLPFDEVGDLEEIQEPSFYAESPLARDDDSRFTQPPSPRTPPPTPAAIINRIRGQVQEKMATERLPCQILEESPAPLTFPEDYPDEELRDLSAPSFATTPQRESPIQHYCSPNISIPQYFEDSPSPRLPTPLAAVYEEMPDASAVSNKSCSPPLLGVHRGLRVKTPEGPFVLPPHPKKRETEIEMIRRAQLIHKIKEKEKAAKPSFKTTHQGLQAQPGKRYGGTGKGLCGTPKPPAVIEESPQESIEFPAETPDLPADYVAAVARARRLAGLKNTRPVLNPPQDYATIRARAADLKAGRGYIEPTEEEIVNEIQNEAENVIRRPDRCQAVSGQEPQSCTPRPALERFKAIRARNYNNGTHTPTTSKAPHISPVKTPVIEGEFSPYHPICLHATPQMHEINEQDLEDISMPDMGDVGDNSMAYDQEDNYCPRSFSITSSDHECNYYSRSFSEDRHCIDRQR